jgi:hypothetical protein
MKLIIAEKPLTAKPIALNRKATTKCDGYLKETDTSSLQHSVTSLDFSNPKTMMSDKRPGPSHTFRFFKDFNIKFSKGPIGRIDFS